MESWLDTETKALLQKSPPKKLAPPDTAAFSLVLLSIYRHDIEREIRAIQRILQTSNNVEARHLLGQPLPVRITEGLTHGDALLGQFELISCDSVSVFIEDDVVKSASQDYLDNLYQQLLSSDEFQEVLVQIDSLPANDQGNKFVDQFIGDSVQKFPSDLTTLRKKARIMQHWAAKIGGAVSLVQE